MNEENYTSTTPEIFATTPEKVDALVACAFVDRTVFLINERWYAQEYSTDEMICPLQKRQETGMTEVATQGCITISELPTKASYAPPTTG